MDLRTRIKVVLLMAEFKSPTLVHRALAQEGRNRLPNVSTISRLFNKFCSSGSVLNLPRPGRPKVTTEQSIHKIEQILGEKPQATLGELSLATGVSRSTVRRRIKSMLGLNLLKGRHVSTLYSQSSETSPNPIVSKTMDELDVVFISFLKVALRSIRRTRRTNIQLSSRSDATRSRH